MESYLTNILEQPQLVPDRKGAMEAALVRSEPRPCALLIAGFVTKGFADHGVL
jgi:hypothetical protein